MEHLQPTLMEGLINFDPSFYEYVTVKSIYQEYVIAWKICKTAHLHS